MKRQAEGILAEIKVAARTRRDLVDRLRQIVDHIEREHPTVKHWGGQHGRAGSYSVSISGLDENVQIADGSDEECYPT
jgi:hypothetical protein